LANYFTEIKDATSSLLTGLGETWRHMRKGHKARGAVAVDDHNYFVQADKAVTIQYPAQQIPVPDVGRYRLHMETDDCIVCDKCARICPVDCIDIEGIKATEELGETSDGSKKRLHLATFDIDMAKCCYCGLCTTVCPTECLTMTKVFDFSEFDRERFIYHFGGLSPEEAQEKAAELAADKARKAAEKAADPVKKKPALKAKPRLSLKKKDNKEE